MKKILMVSIVALTALAAGILVISINTEDERPKIPIDKIDTSGASDKA